MPRSRKFPPTPHSRKDGTSFVRIWENGKPREVYLGKTGSPEAQQKYAQVVAELAAKMTQPATLPLALSQWTVADVCGQFLDHADDSYSARGKEAKQYGYALRPVTVLFGTLPARDFGAEHLERVMVSMATGDWMDAATREEYASLRIATAWSRSVVSRRLTRVRTVWRWAEMRKLVPPGSLAALAPVRVPVRDDPRFRRTPPRQAATDADFETVCAECPPAVAAMLRLLYWSGMRPGEVRIMRPADIDRTGDVWRYTPREHKNDWRGQSRVVSLGPECQKILAPWLEGCGEEEYLFRPISRTAVNDHYTSEALSHAVSKAAQRAGVSFMAYSLRHSAKQRLTRAHGLDKARAVLGQKSILSTDGYASGIDQDQADDTMRKAG